MARVTVEDCIDAVPNAFELVLVAAKRARELGAGAQPTVDPEDEKSTVVAPSSCENTRTDGGGGAAGSGSADSSGGGGTAAWASGKGSWGGGGVTATCCAEGGVTGCCSCRPAGDTGT